jgi:hypothetical protein
MPTGKAARRSTAQGALAGVVLGVVTACATGSTTRAAPSPATVRVLVYNMHAGKDAAGVDNLDGVADVVRTTAADIVLLQEVDRKTRRSQDVDQPAVLATKTGFHSAFGSTLHYEGGEYGIAVLSRWPIARDTLYPLPIDPPQERAGGSHEPRGALHVVITSPHGAISVFNTRTSIPRATTIGGDRKPIAFACSSTRHTAAAHAWCLPVGTSIPHPRVPCSKACAPAGCATHGSSAVAAMASPIQPIRR